MAWSCLSTAASRPSEFAPDRRKVANRREQGRHTRTDHPGPSEKDLSMTAALSDPSLDQIFRSARTFNGWADRAVADAKVREIYDLMKWGPTSANCSPARFVWVRSADGKATLAGLAAEQNKPKILQAPSRSLSATIWISRASFQSFCLTMPRSCRSTLRDQAWPR